MQRSRKHPFGAHLLRRTASAPTKGQAKIKKGFPDITIDTKDYSSEGASEEHESAEKASVATSHEYTQAQHNNGDSLTSDQTKGPWDHPDTSFQPGEGKGKSLFNAQRHPMSEPLKRAIRLHFHDPLNIKPGVFARVTLNSSGRVGMSSNCITCVIGSKESPEAERKCESEQRQECKSKDEDEEIPKKSSWSSSSKRQVQSEPAAQPIAAQPDLQRVPPKPKVCKEPQTQYSPQAVLQTIPFPRSKLRQTLGAQHRPGASHRYIPFFSIPRRHSPNAVTQAPSLTPDCRTNLQWQQSTPPIYGAATSSHTNAGVVFSDSSSCHSFGSFSSLESLPTLPPRSVLDNRKRAVGTLQREMNALFAQKMEELRRKSPMFFAGKTYLRQL